MLPLPGARAVSGHPVVLFLLLLYQAVFLPYLAPSLALADADAPTRSTAYLNELISRAEQEKLYERPEWTKLLHYRKKLGGRVESFADDPSFFQAPDGKNNPEHELQATLAAFFQEAEAKASDQHPQCRFAARYSWLKEELRFDSRRLPEQDCPRFQEWKSALNPSGVTLVFPAAYLNNPASMYGHTLLRIDAHGQDERTRLLAYSANYAAETGTDGGLAFMLKGLFGGYAGAFSVRPYYEQVKLYTDLENRDIWEYELDLSQAEVDRLIQHLWELRLTYFDYYFFDENCSFHLLSLIDYARPGTNLAEQFPLWAIPSDTVRAAADVPGLVRKVVYRPSASSVLRHQLQSLPDGRSRLLSRNIALGRVSLDDERLSPFGSGEQAEIFDTAISYLEYLRFLGRGDEAPPARLLSLMQKRSTIESPPAEPVPVPAVRPDQGHRSARLSLGAGVRAGSKFYEVSARPAYHDLLDPPGGYLPTSQIDFFSVRGRQIEGDAFRLESFFPLDIVSLSPWNLMIRPWSWNFAAGLERRYFSSTDSGLAAVIKGGPGAAFQPLPGITGFALMQGQLEFSPSYTNGDCAAGAGPYAGVLTDSYENLRLGLFGRFLDFGLGSSHRSAEAALEARIKLDNDDSLSLRLSRRGEFNEYATETTLSWQRFF